MNDRLKQRGLLQVRCGKFCNLRIKTQRMVGLQVILYTHTYIYINIFIGDGKGKRNHATHEKETRLTVRKWII